MLDLVKTESGADVSIQTSQDEILGFLWEFNIVIPDKITGDDLIILLKWNISTKHVVEKNTKTPSCQTVTCNQGSLKNIDDVWDKFYSPVYCL